MKLAVIWIAVVDIRLGLCRITQVDCHDPPGLLALATIVLEGWFGCCGQVDLMLGFQRATLHSNLPNGKANCANELS